MPTKSEARAAIDRIKGLESASFRRDGNRVIEAMDGELSFRDLSEGERMEQLGGLRWDGFADDQAEQVMSRVADGMEPWQWMEGITDDVRHHEDGERILTPAEHEAYLADIAASCGMTTEEMDDYYERLWTEEAAHSPDEQAAATKIEWLKSMSYFQEEGRTPEPCSDCSLPWWEDLSAGEKRAVLDAEVDWRGFSAEKREELIAGALIERDAPEPIPIDPEVDRIMSAMEEEWQARENPTGRENAAPESQPERAGHARDAITELADGGYDKAFKAAVEQARYRSDGREREGPER